MVIAFSTIPGYVSNRDKEKGTWFIQSVCKVSTSRLVDNITIQIPCWNRISLFSLKIHYTTHIWSLKTKCEGFLQNTDRSYRDYCLTVGSVCKVALSQLCCFIPSMGKVDKILRSCRVTFPLCPAGVQREGLLHLPAGHAGPGGARPQEQPPEWDWN